MRILTLILLLTFSNLAQCQTANIITETEFNNIEVNGFNLTTIKNTLGEQNAMQALFGVAEEEIIDPDGEFTHFEFDGLNIGFSTLLSGDINQPILGAFHITNNNSNIKIQGITVTIGDNISLLENVDFNTNLDGTNSILYMHCEGCNSFILINFNQTTNVITEISYIEQT